MVSDALTSFEPNDAGPASSTPQPGPHADPHAPTGVRSTRRPPTVVPRGTVHIVERLGRMQSIQADGFYFRVPFLDKIRYVVDVRERSLQIHPQHAITKDNVSVELDGVIMVQVLDPEKACYAVQNPYVSVVQHAQSAMRSAIGRRTLDDAFHDRAGLNRDIRSDLEKAADSWGLDVRRYEVLNIAADESVAKAMDLQATAERKRREEITGAEAHKRSEILRAEGAAQATEMKAKAEKRATVLAAEGYKEHLKLKAAGEAEAIAAIAKALGGKPEDAHLSATIKLLQEHYKMMGEVGGKSNTFFFGGADPGDLTDVLARLTATVNAVGGGSQGVMGGVSGAAGAGTPGH